MNHAKRILSLALSAVLLGAVLLMGGCASPDDVAMEVDGTKIKTGEYLAYLYSEYNDYSYTIQAYSSYNMDFWGQTQTYGDDKDTKYSQADYMKLVAQDLVVRQFALKNLMKDKGISADKETADEIKKTLDNMGSDALLTYGISDESFAKMANERYVLESSALYGMYDVGGTEKVSEATLRQHFTDNYLSYKIISLSLDGLTGEKLTNAKNRMNGYKTAYESSKNFDQVIRQYNADEKAASSDATDTSTDANTDNRINVVDASDSKTNTDQELMKAIKKVPVGEAQLVTYTDSSNKETLALIQRINPNDDQVAGTDLFKNNRKTYVSNLYSEAFDKVVKEYVGKLKVTINKKVCDRYSVKDFATTTNA